MQRTASIAMLLALTACSTSPVGSSANFAAPAIHRRATTSPIQHIVFIVQEGRSFDNVFHDFPGANSAKSGKGIGGHTYPLKQIPLKSEVALGESHYQFLEDSDAGKNDGFVGQIAGSNNAHDYCKNDNWVNEPACWKFNEREMRMPYSYVKPSDIQPYLDMAKQYVLGDNMFASNNGPQFPALQFLIAGESGGAAEEPAGSTWGCGDRRESELYLQAGAAKPPAFPPSVGHEVKGPEPCFPLQSSGAYPTIASELDGAGVTWRMYAPPMIAGGRIDPYGAVKAIRYGPDWTNGDISFPNTNVLSDISDGRLQQVSWVLPTHPESDHAGPGAGDLGPKWVSSLVNAIGESQYWNSTAIVILWDDWGGWYDHVAPKQYGDPATGLDEGLGFRVPLIVVSPYAKAAYVSHDQHETASTLHFIEQTFGLPPLGSSSGMKYADQRADAFDDCFDFTQQPRAFVPIRN